MAQTWSRSLVCLGAENQRCSPETDTTFLVVPTHSNCPPGKGQSPQKTSGRSKTTQPTELAANCGHLPTHLDGSLLSALPPSQTPLPARKRKSQQDLALAKAGDSPKQNSTSPEAAARWHGLSALHLVTWVASTACPAKTTLPSPPKETYSPQQPRHARSPRQALNIWHPRSPSEAHPTQQTGAQEKGSATQKYRPHKSSL